jgi:antitoxin YafN
MPLQPIFAEKTVSVTELRKHPSQFFLNEPVAVLSNNKTAGYIIGAALFEKIVHQLEINAATNSATFRPSVARLASIAALGADMLLKTSDEELAGFEK